MQKIVKISGHNPICVLTVCTGELDIKIRDDLNSNFTYSPSTYSQSFNHNESSDI